MSQFNHQTPWLDLKYVKLLSSKLERFKVLSENPVLANFRCPECGDSHQSKYKARGYLYKAKDGVNFMCHNCGSGMGLKKFLKKHDSHLYGEYIMEVMKESGAKDRSLPQALKVVDKPPVRLEVHPGLIPVDTLGPFHPAAKYWKSRSLPLDRASDAYFVDSFYGWVNENVVPDKFGMSLGDSPRLVLPIRDPDGSVTGYTGRSLNDEKPKYVSVTAPGRDSMGFFGSERFKSDEVRFLVEGPFDSMMLPRCVALMGLNRDADYPNAVYVFDNEPRNAAVVKRMKKAIDKGSPVVVWGKNFRVKDLNDAVVTLGMTRDDLLCEVEARTFTGARARIELSGWLSW